MGVAGYEKVKTKVIEGKKKCIYKKPKGTKQYVKGFGKMRSVESYIKLCKKKAAKAAKAAKPMKAKKVRSKAAKKYGGFLQEFFANMEGEGFATAEKEKKHHDKFSTSAMEGSVAAKHSGSPASHASQASPSTPPPTKTGGSSCKRGGNGMLENLSSAVQNTVSGSLSGGYRGGQEQSEQFQEQAEQFQDPSQQEGGRRRKKNKASKSMLDKLMMATFKKRSAKKGKKPRRKGGNILSQLGNEAGSALGNLGLMGGRKAKKGRKAGKAGKAGKARRGGQSQYE